jgi:alcohol dehydrogenase (cytochrome c)
MLGQYCRHSYILARITRPSFAPGEAYVDAINWTKGIDQKTGKPVDYDPGKDIQVYSDQTFMERARKLCQSMPGGQ